MRQTWAWLVAVIGVGGIVFFASGCEVGYPFRGPGYERGKGVVGPGAGRELVVAITQGDIESGAKGRFGEHLQTVLATMGEHDGLVGYSVRKQLLGSRVWTMSVWIDENALDEFVQSPAHRQAMKDGGIRPGSFVYAQIRCPSDQIPLKWSSAKQILADQHRQEPSGQ